MSPQNPPRPNKAERNGDAREKARLLREAQLKKEKRKGWLIRGGVLAAAVAIIVIIALVVINTQKANAPVADSGPVPANMNVYGGITLGKDGAVIAPTTTETTVDVTSVREAPTAPSEKAFELEDIGIKATADGEPIQAVVYFDFMCPFCGQFEQQYGPQLKQLASEGKVTVEYRALGFLDRFGGGTNYSSRAGAAAACVADVSPSSFQPFLDRLFVDQPKENSKGINNATLNKYAVEAGSEDISGCIDSKNFRPYVANTTALASAHGVSSTPSVFMDGEQWMSTEGFDTFLQRTLDAKK